MPNLAVPVVPVNDSLPYDGRTSTALWFCFAKRRCICRLSADHGYSLLPKERQFARQTLLVASAGLRFRWCYMAFRETYNMQGIIKEWGRGRYRHSRKWLTDSCSYWSNWFRNSEIASMWNRNGSLCSFYCRSCQPNQNWKGHGYIDDYMMMVDFHLELGMLIIYRRARGRPTREDVVKIFFRWLRLCSILGENVPSWHRLYIKENLHKIWLWSVCCGFIEIHVI